MGITEAILDRISATTLKNCPVTVHTNTGETGRIEKTSIIKGTVTVRLSSDGSQVFPGRAVADLDTPLFTNPKP